MKPSLLSLIGCLTIAFSALGTRACAEPASDDQVDYLSEIKPLLRARCYACHGALKQKGGLRLDTAAFLVQGGDSGAIIDLESPSDSTLILRVATDDIDMRMPPEHEGEPFEQEHIELLRRWIKSGAPQPTVEQPEEDPSKHWAFQPIERPSLPEPVATSSVNPIDAFLSAARMRADIPTQQPAPPIVQLRRLYLDLIGLPPTAEQIDNFLQDPSPEAYDRVVEDLLNDPRYGERWARHWMDIWRYSDWWGLGDQLRNSQKHLWHWRDWIIESLNEDVGYDEMIRQMLAADELYPEDIERLRATGFLARNYFLFNRAQWMEETVEHVSKGLLGLTMNCAKCHDHKYDPIAQDEFYAIRAFFEPYHVRLDMVPGVTDLAQDGIPRVYDGLLEEPTYRYIRGDERSPDKSQIIAPAVPKFIGFDNIDVQPIELPASAYQPQRRPWVIPAHLDVLQSKVQQAQQRVQQAQEALQAAKAKEQEMLEQLANAPQDPPPAQDELIINDDFTTLDPTLWQIVGGDWGIEPGWVEQKQLGSQQAALRLLKLPPSDFEAEVEFTTMAGQQWKSVGLSYDTELDPASSLTSSPTNEQNVYVSAYSGGPKVQAAFSQNGQWQYPGGGASKATPIELNRRYTLRVQVRGNLVNAYLDGQLMVAWQSPLPRRQGSIQLTTFDAHAVFHRFKLQPLDPQVSLQPPSEPAQNTPLNTADAARAAVLLAVKTLVVAEANLEAADAELAAGNAREGAWKARWAHEQAETTISTEPNSNSELVTSHEAAVTAERMLAAAKAKVAVAEAEFNQQKAVGDARAAAEQALKTATDNLAAAESAIEAPIDPNAEITPFVGAAWTPTRFLHSGNDDPTITFPATSSGRRSALAKWITDHRNPLTARVAANHLWSRHFGQSLVATEFDFGRNGARPAHPQLLDWLSSELIDSGWSMKQLHRLIVTSEAYRLSSSELGMEQARRIDPENRLLWRRSPLRLESQVIRDAMLSLAGDLDETLYGASVPMAAQANSTRRSIYFFHSNNERNLFLSSFDEALVTACYRREQSIVPQQALALTNSDLALRSSEAIAERLSLDGKDDSQFVVTAFRTIVGIDPDATELAASLTALEKWRSLVTDPAANQALHARSQLVWVLLNHNDFVTLR